jgi:hypothetical protein
MPRWWWSWHGVVGCGWVGRNVHAYVLMFWVHSWTTGGGKQKLPYIQTNKQTSAPLALGGIEDAAVRERPMKEDADGAAGRCGSCFSRCPTDLLGKEGVVVGCWFCSVSVVWRLGAAGRRRGRSMGGWMDGWMDGGMDGGRDGSHDRSIDWGHWTELPPTSLVGSRSQVLAVHACAYI